MNRLMMLITVCIFSCSGGIAEGDFPRVSTTSFSFNGTASGGTLIIGSSLSRNSRFVSIETVAGESAESVVYRLAEAIAYSDRLFSYGRRTNLDRGRLVASIALGNTLRLRGAPGTYFVAGTEKGLGIPQPPVSLSCSYDKMADEITCNWINPPGGYDHIRIMRSNKGGLSGSDRIEGSQTEFKITRQTMDFDANDLDIRVMGIRNGLMSNVAAIHLSGNAQVELSGIPFTNGIAPNWTAWSTATLGGADFAEQGEKHANLAVDFNLVRALLAKPFYQVIKAGSSGSINGVCRKFLGLAGGHTYRISACLTTLEMESAKGDWSFEFCAAHNRADGKDLTAQEMAGLADLPNRSSGPSAGRIVSYSRGNTTEGKYKIIFSADKAAGGSGSPHITLPDNVDTITVWVRFTCDDPNGKVGLLGVRLEDIAGSAGIKTPQDIIQQEITEEAEVLRKEERALLWTTRRK